MLISYRLLAKVNSGSHMISTTEGPRVLAHISSPKRPNQWCKILLLLLLPAFHPAQPRNSSKMLTAATTTTSSTLRFQTTFLRVPHKLSCFTSSSSSLSSQQLARNQRIPNYPVIRALDLDQNTVVAISVGLVSVAAGIGIPIFYESQIDSAASRENTQPCFPCNGSGAQKCRFCLGDGTVTVELGGDEKEVSKCINCDGAGALTCTTCQGSGIQPRYLDRREFKDDD